MSSAFAELEQQAQAHDFSGVVRVERRGEVIAEFACGLSDRANQRVNNLETRFAVASGNKPLTALTTMSLVESGAFNLDTTLRSVVQGDLPHVDEAVTIDHLLTHRSGVGDYLDEGPGVDIDDHVLGSRSAHTLETARDYLPLLNAHEQLSAPGKHFAYNNSGFVMLSLAIETTTGSYHQAVRDHVFTRAGMPNAEFLRTDDLPANTALGYLSNGRSNIFHLPVVGMGDGGAFFTLDDTTAFWDAFLNGRIVSPQSVAAMTEEVSVHNDSRSYGRGFWLNRRADHVWIEGMDAGVSFQSGVFRDADVRYSVLANTSSGAWPLVKTICDITTQLRRDHRRGPELRSPEGDAIRVGRPLRPRAGDPDRQVPASGRGGDPRCVEDESRPRGWSRLKLGVAIAVWAVLLASCSGEGDDASSTSVSSTTAAPVSSTTAAPVSSTTVARPVFGSLEELAEHRYAGGLGAVIVGVFEDSSPHVAGIGEDGDGVAVDADRPWHTASLAKVFTAATVLQLVDDGSIDLDGPIADYVDFPVSDQITVRHVLGHRSNIRDTRPVQCSDQTRVDEVIELAGLPTEPSTTTDYSNSNYVLLGLVIGSVTGQDPGDYIRDEVFTPLGMSSTYWYESQTGPRPWFRNVDSVESFGSYDCGEPGPTIGTDGGAITTLADIDAFYRGLFNGAILEAGTLAAMLEMNGELFGDGYGLGIGRITNDAFPDESLYGFGGDGGFFGTMAFHDPDKQRTVAMFFTQGDRMNIFWDLVAWANNQNSD